MPKVSTEPSRRSSRNLNSTVNYRTEQSPPRARTPSPTKPKPVQRKKTPPLASVNLDTMSNADLEVFFDVEAKTKRRCKQCLNVFQPRANIFRAHLRVCSGIPQRNRTTSRTGVSPTKDDITAHFTKHGTRNSKMKCNFCLHLFSKKPLTLSSHLATCNMRPADLALGVGARLPVEVIAQDPPVEIPPVDAEIAQAQFDDFERNGKKRCKHCSNLFPNKIDTLRSHLVKCQVYAGPLP